MPSRSKWQSLPTEAINPATLAIDKLSPADIVEGMLHEDRKMLLAVQHEKDRIACGVEIIAQALRHGGRIIFVGAGTSGRLGVLESAEMPPTFGTDPDLVLAIMAGGKECLPARHGRRRGQPRRRRAVDQQAAAVEEGRRHRGVGERDDAVRPRRAHAGAPGRIEDHLRHLRSADRAADLRRSDHRARRRPRGDRRIHAAQGRHGDQDGPQHADDGGDDPHRQDLRQPHGRRAGRVREAARPGAAHHHHRDRSRVRRRRQAAAPRTGTSRRRS